MKKVYGSYLTSTEARKAVDELLQQGYSRDEIKVVSNSNLGGDLNYNENDVHEDDRSLWEKIKDAFTFDEYDDDYWNKDLDNSERSLLEGYRDNLQAGETVVLVEEGASEYRDTFRDGVPDWDEREEEFNEDIDIEPPMTGTGMPATPLSEDYKAGLNVTKDDLDRSNLNIDEREHLGEDERVLELKKEKLNVDKEEVQTGEVGVRKVVKEETQTIEVPVEKEEIIIERRSAGDREVRDGEILDTDSFKEGEEIHIPIKEERVEVTKKTVVDDEVVIRKDKHKENQTVTETLRHEDIEVEGDAEVRDDEINRANVGKNNLNRDNAGTVDVNLNNVDESSINNMDRDPLRDDNLNDDGLERNNLNDLDRESLNKDDSIMDDLSKEELEDEIDRDRNKRI